VVPRFGLVEVGWAMTWEAMAWFALVHWPDYQLGYGERICDHLVTSWVVGCPRFSGGLMA